MFHQIDTTAFESAPTYHEPPTSDLYGYAHTCVLLLPHTSTHRFYIHDAPDHSCRSDDLHHDAYRRKRCYHFHGAHKPNHPHLGSPAVLCRLLGALSSAQPPSGVSAHAVLDVCGAVSDDVILPVSLHHYCCWRLLFTCTASWGCWCRHRYDGGRSGSGCGRQHDGRGGEPGRVVGGGDGEAEEIGGGKQDGGWSARGYRLGLGRESVGDWEVEVRFLFLLFVC